MIDENSSPRLPAILAVLLIAMPVAAVVPTTTAEQAQPPTLEALEWLPRGENETGAPTLRVSLTVSAPAGLAGGEVTAKAFNYQIVDTATLPSLEAGTHDILVETTMDRYEDFDRELTGLVLEGEEGQRSVYDLCDLASIGENQERPDPDDPRLDVECLPRGGGWAVWTVEATGEEAWARTWERGVSSGGGEIAGLGHVAQDEEGELATWGVLVGRIATDHGDETYLRVAGETLVDESEPDDHPHYEIVIGAGSLKQEIPEGEVFTFAAYYATEEDTFLNQRMLELEGNNITVLDRKVGDDVGLLTTEDYDFDARLRQESPVAGLGVSSHALGEVNLTAEDSLTYFTAWFRGLQHTFTSASVAYGEGPDGPLVGTYPVARSAGDYSWYVHASATTDPDADWALAYADMPVPPNPTNVVRELT